MKQFRSLIFVLATTVSTTPALAHPGHGPGDPVAEVEHIFLRAETIGVTGAVIFFGVTACVLRRARQSKDQ